VPIRIGDVGFIDEGQFHLLFYAGSQPGQELGVNVPKSFVPLTIKETSFRTPRKAGRLSSRHVQEVEVTASATGYALSLGQSPAFLRNVLHRTQGARPYFSLRLGGKRGAALVTRYPTYIEVASHQATFDDYTKRHYESWVAFAREEGYKPGIQPVLVYGIDVTRDLAMTAYSKTSFETDLFINLPTVVAPGVLEANPAINLPAVTVSASSQTTRDTTTLDSHQWPLEWGETTMNIPPEGKKPPGGFDRCVFIRCCTKDIKDQKGKKGGRLVTHIWNSAFGSQGAPHDPGSTAQPDVGPAASGDGNLGGEWVDIPGDTVREAPHVWPQPPPFISTLTFTFRARGVTASMALQTIYTR